MLSLRALLDALGGPSAVARACKITPSAVSNWLARDSVAAEHRLRIWRMAQEAGLEWTPAEASGLKLCRRDEAA